MKAKLFQFYTGYMGHDSKTRWALYVEDGTQIETSTEERVREIAQKLEIEIVNGVQDTE